MRDILDMKLWLIDVVKMGLPPLLEDSGVNLSHLVFPVMYTQTSKRFFSEHTYIHTNEIGVQEQKM